MSNKTIEVTALGELLIDFTGCGLSAQGNPIFEANPGGAPCNVLAMLRKFGRNCAFIGKVGDDIFGNQLRKTIESIGINTEGLMLEPCIRTTLAFVQILENGDRDFAFFRNPGADMMLNEADIDLQLINRSKIFHFGTLSMTHESNRKATIMAVEKAKESGCLISFDPNHRPLLWSSQKDAKAQIECGLSYCQVVKIADNELEFITGEKDLDKAAKMLKNLYPNIKLLNVTFGSDGSCAYYESFSVYVPAFKTEKTVDTTGAGDTFCGCVLNYLLGHDINNLNENNLNEMLLTANAAASLVTTRKGALGSMPTPDDISGVLGK